MDKVFLYEKRGYIAYLTFNRPQVRNAISPEVLGRLADAWLDYAADDSLRVAIITGAGDRAFTAGADLGTMIPLLTGARAPVDEWDHRMIRDPDGLSRIAMLREYHLEKPVIAAINGVSVGAGTELMQATDLRIAAEHATFSLTEVARGFMPGGGSAVRLPKQIPYCKAMELLLTAAPMSAQEAYRIGLVNEVVPGHEVMARAEAWARIIADNGPLAVRMTKKTVLQTLGRPLEEGYALEKVNAEITMKSEDAREGPRAFMEKRKPNFRGR
jgi:enoyl-CoA hydratase